MGKKSRQKEENILTNYSKCYIIGLSLNWEASMFSDQVKYVRNRLNLSQKKFADLLGVSFATINRWENSKNEPSQLAKNSFYDFCENNFIDVEELKKH